MNDFERELESELHRMLDPMSAAPVPPRRVKDAGGAMKKLLSGVGAAVGVKLLTGIAVAAAAVTVAAAATEVASTGSINPVDWGKQVTQQVQTCKDTLRASGTRGIGQCVSQFAKQHGKVVSGEHRASDARGHGQGSSNDKGSGKNKSHDNGSNNGHAPLTVPTGEPTGLPRP